MRVTQILLFLLATSPIFAQPVTVRPDGWVLGTEFPGQPEEQVKRTPTPVGDVVETMWGLEVRDEVLGSMRVQYPVAIPAERHDSAYEGGKRGLLRSRNGRLLSEEKIRLATHAGRRWLVEVTDGTRVIDVRVAIIGNVLYQFMYERPKEIPDSPESRRFFEAIFSDR